MNSHRCLFPVLLLIAIGSGGVHAAVAVDTALTFRQIEHFLGAPAKAGDEKHWIELKVGCGDYVTAGQQLAVQRNAAGEIVQEYTARAPGRVRMVARGAQGAPVLEINTLSESTACAGGDCAAH
ncbi:hypothetical protein [Microbulbifer litoralis]|uniref:hypothetical protein n=1 Tax=Microbulbifer litoralis TaxID=2933965 RepID=UPI0020286C68|nr:hypothetical protein [Microbulbifer sp. GX H0434]